ncbi:MAG: hypothetical protein JSU08_03510 [Acidobacteria bacterium]|nr:hypothetical protein [Acidobacteriota bacterium]
MDWIRIQNAARSDVYVSFNALAGGAQSRRRHDVAAVRHVFLDVDHNAQGVLGQLVRRSNVPQPSYVVHTSPNRAHLLWRVRDFDTGAAERLQKQMAADLEGDPAATSVTQLTRLPGFWNQKYDEPYLVWVDYRDVEHVYTPHDFPFTDHAMPVRSEPAPAPGRHSPVERANAYLSQVPPAVAGQHGDLHTFQTCCRIVRGFALDDDQALAVLADWNARCQPPWTERELLQKIGSARRNGREPMGGLL